ncbi:MAG: transglutaminaseTgpA domain-containing protein [Chloroflexota bacterium]
MSGPSVPGGVPPQVVSPPPAAPRAPTRLRRLLAPPPTGWASVVALFAMLVIAGLAMDAPHLAQYGPSGASQTAFLPLTLALSGLVGAVLARTPLPTTIAHLLGALIGVSVLLIGWGAAISDAATLAGQLRDVNASAARLFQDAVINRGRTSETIGFLMVIGAIGWTTGQFAAYNLVRRGLVAPAIVAVGTVVIIIALAPTVQPDLMYPYLVAITGLSLFLVLRANLTHQQASWRRRHIVGGAGVGRSFLRGGAAVAIVALLAASFLGVNAVVAPLSQPLTNMNEPLVGVVSFLSSLLNAGTTGTDAANGEFGDVATIEDTWHQRGGTLFTASIDDDGLYYWRGGTYVDFDGTRWSNDGPDTPTGQTRRVPAEGDLLAGSVDAIAANPATTRQVTFTVTSEDLKSTLLAPALPMTATKESLVILNGANGPLRRIGLPRPLGQGESYTVVSWVPLTDDDGLTQARLANAQSDDQEAWLAPYKAQPGPDVLSPSALAVATRLVNDLPKDQRDAYHIAARYESWFSGSAPPFDSDKARFSYATDIADKCSPDLNVVDCLLKIKVGFCQHYATAMTLFLRSQNIPARYVQGYLPGKPLGDGQWEIPASAAHAWVEVWFPDIGWVAFDPTPGLDGQQRTADLPPGDPFATPAPTDAVGPDQSVVPSLEPSPSPSPQPSADSQVVPPPPQAGPDLPLPLLLLLLLAILLAILAVLVVLFLRRVPGRDPDALYRAIAALAARTGRGPRPAQTAYEFTASLSRSVPAVQDDLRAVADAKVEAQYGGRAADGDRIEALLASFRRVRRALYALFLSRGRR